LPLRTVQFSGMHFFRCIAPMAGIVTHACPRLISCPQMSQYDLQFAQGGPYLKCFDPRDFRAFVLCGQGLFARQS
jgi:hypothetical protein